MIDVQSLETHLETLKTVNSDLAAAVQGYERLIEQAKDGRLPPGIDNHRLSIANTSVKLCSFKAADVKTAVSALLD